MQIDSIRSSECFLGFETEFGNSCSSLIIAVVNRFDVEEKACHLNF